MRCRGGRFYNLCRNRCRPVGQVFGIQMFYFEFLRAQCPYTMGRNGPGVAGGSKVGFRN